MIEKILEQIEEEILNYEVADDAVEEAGTSTELAVAWTSVCSGIQCRD